MLAPCTSCQRHIRVDDICPFCGGERARMAPVALLGRISRIAVFTSAAFAANACRSPEYPSTVKMGEVKGIASWSGTNMFGTRGGPLHAATVTLRSNDGKIRRSTKTDAEGEFKFDDVPVGTYSLTLTTKKYTGSRPEPVQVEVHANWIENVDLTSHVALPYGAPPARRRVV